MADKAKIKELLRKKIRPGKYLSEAQIDTAADLLIKIQKADADSMRKLGEDVAHDAETFSSFDTTDLNGELGRFGK
jgi:hypothetical protein